MGDSQINKIFALIIILVLAGLLIYGLSPYYSAFFGAIILSVLLRPIYKRFCKKLSKPLSAILTILIGLLIVLIPLSIATTLIFSEVGTVIKAGSELAQQSQEITSNLPIDTASFISDVVQSFGSIVRSFLLGAVSGFSTFMISMIILVFLLYYLLTRSKQISNAFVEIIPFSKKNARKLSEELSNVTNSVVITSGLIAIIQGVLLGIGFAIAGFPGPVLWGFIGAILSFLPVVGPTIIWLPAGIIALAQQNYFGGIFIVIWGFVSSQSDNFTRPRFQQRVGKIHPLISIIGIFAGLSLFGVIGVIIGPLILSYFFLTTKMFKEEYLDE